MRWKLGSFFLWGNHFSYFPINCTEQTSEYIFSFVYWSSYYIFTFLGSFIFLWFLGILSSLQRGKLELNMFMKKHRFSLFMFFKKTCFEFNALLKLVGFTEILSYIQCPVNFFPNVVSCFRKNHQRIRVTVAPRTR